MSGDGFCVLVIACIIAEKKIRQSRVTEPFCGLTEKMQGMASNAMYSDEDDDILDQTD